LAGSVAMLLRLTAAFLHLAYVSTSKSPWDRRVNNRPQGCDQGLASRVAGLIDGNRIPRPRGKDGLKILKMHQTTSSKHLAHQAPAQMPRAALHALV
jgi:hypothetical protein